jgi:hypothetical protein
MRQDRWNYRQMPFAPKANGVRIRAVSSKTHMANTCYNAAMTQDSSNNDALPDRLSIDPGSPHYNETLIARGVGIRFNGAEKTNIEEYCVSEGWVRITAGKSRDRHGRPLTIKLKGKVEPFLKDASPPATE